MFFPVVSRLLRVEWGATPYLDDRGADEINPEVLASQARHGASMLQQFVEELAAMASLSESYESRVPVKINVPGEDYAPPDRLFLNIEQGDSFYALEVSNPSSFTVEKDGDTYVRNGLAINVFGTSNFQAAPQRDYRTNAGEEITNYALLVDQQLVGVKFQVQNTALVQFGDYVVYQNGTWYGGPTDSKVKLSTSSDTAKYLKFHFADFSTATFDATYDIPIKVIISSGQLKFFIDASDLTNFSTGQNQVLGHLASAGFKLINLGTCS